MIFRPGSISGSDDSPQHPIDAVLFQFSRYPQFITTGVLLEAIIIDIDIFMQLFMNRTAKLRNFFEPLSPTPQKIDARVTDVNIFSIVFLFIADWSSYQKRTFLALPLTRRI